MPNNQKQNQQNDKFWNFIPGTEAKPPELLLYGAISSQQSWWEDRVTPAAFNKELAELGDVPEIVVRINSGGGDVFAANAIYTRLKDHSAKITVKVDGWAASAATIIAMAGDKVQIARNGVFMIHDPSMTVWDSFTAEEFEKLAEELKVIKQSIINTYAMKTGRESTDIEALMASETWWTGEEAVNNGFCDELMFETSVSAAIENKGRVIVNSVPLDMTAYKTLPNMLQNSPKNPGGFENKTGRKPNAKEEKEVENNGAITTIEALKDAYPDLTAAIENNARAEERQRIKDIKDAAIDGFETLVEDAMFTNPVSAEALALRIVKEQKKQGENYLKGRTDDAKSSGVNNVGDASGESGQEDGDVFDAAINKLFADKNKGEV